ncbi:hypothetical protein J2X20_000775 [Pelomonas saccharophila]|uniref:Uncharacterized protein n=1 Tax=Roseateles saccharophilus TaxID=304 RepID=A0ABU1YIW0_ROSSA|nr:hypothetical protein [Roseateles saccharophilus]MDR7268146.1 hypothetical protein [Roseateles saccharophilus]
MSLECYRVKVPEGRRLTGFTVAGQRVPLLPGEYHVHRLPPKAALTGAAALRFVGAHGLDNDVHIKLPDGADMSKALSVEVQPVEEA